MASWTVPGSVIAVIGAGDILRLRVALAADVHADHEVRLAVPQSPREPLRVGPGARRWVDRVLPPTTRVWFVSECRDRRGRPMGRLMYGVGGRQDLAAGLIDAGLAIPGRRGR